MVKAHLPVHASTGSYNNEAGVPAGACSRTPPSAEAVVLEMGAPSARRHRRALRDRPTHVFGVVANMGSRTEGLSAGAQESHT